MTGFIEIEVEPSHMTGGGQRWKVFHDGAVIIESSKDPESDAARFLFEAGADLDDRLIVRHRGNPTISFDVRLGAFAGTATSEGSSGGPRRVPWTPYSGPVTEEENAQENA